MKRMLFITGMILLLLINSVHTAPATKLQIVEPDIRSYQIPINRDYNRYLTTTTEPTTEAPTTTEVPTTVTIKTTTTVKTTTTEAQVQEQAIESVDINQDWGHCPDAILHEDESNSCWSGLVAQYDWPLALMLKILYCESKGKRSAHNSSGANGLMQDLGGPYDPKQNMDEAYAKYTAAEPHTQPWISSRPCWS